ncbi:MAG: Mth938-like domain-containing protein [Gammaproteobacteria bacterium]
MKLHADRPDQYSITAYGEGWIAVNGQRHSGPLLISADSGVRAWSCQGFNQMAEEHFRELLEPGVPPPELVLFGSGPRLRFVHPSLLRPLISQRIGVETMDTVAACRTFNILAAEGRRVTAALLVDDI